MVQSSRKNTSRMSWRFFLEQLRHCFLLNSLFQVKRHLRNLSRDQRGTNFILFLHPQSYCLKSYLEFSAKKNSRKVINLIRILLPLADSNAPSRHQRRIHQKTEQQSRTIPQLVNWWRSSPLLSPPTAGKKFASLSFFDYANLECNAAGNQIYINGRK